MNIFGEAGDIHGLITTHTIYKCINETQYFTQEIKSL